jgi:ABC-type nitrate/sulfonate/bicarbonate transport system substrate-binding protein
MRRQPLFFALVVTLTAGMILPWVQNPSFAQSIKIGKTIGGSGFHIPSYIAVDKGLLKAEGLNADFISTTAGVLVRAAIAKEIEFVPIPGGGSEAMLKGAPLAFIVGESLVSQWTIVTQPEFKQVEDLKGKTMGLERPGQAAYTEAVVVLGKFFKMEPGKDYKVITFNAETDRVAALINKSIHAAILSFPHAARAEKAGMKILVKTGDYIPRLGGTFITHRDFLKEKRDVTKRFIRAMVRANDYVKANRQGTIEVIQKYFEIKDNALAEGIYKQVANAFGPEIPHDLLLELFQSRTTPELGWPAGKALPDIEQFVARDLLNEVLKEMGRKVTK